MYLKPSIFILSCIIGITFSCQYSSKENKKDSFTINYLDEYVVYNDSIFRHSKIGGLSGITYDKTKDIYYIVCDDAKMPRFYTASIAIKEQSLNSIHIDTVTILADSTQLFLDTRTLDLEAIRTFDTDKFIFASEGSIEHQHDPSIFITDSIGNPIAKFELPTYFNADTTTNHPRHNGVFEGVTIDMNRTGYWVATELPLLADGEEPSISSSGAPVRITHFTNHTLQADRQFTYPLDTLTKDPKGEFGVNGVTGLIQLTTHQFIMIERGYVAGYGHQGNTIRIYLADNTHSTNTLDVLSLKNKNIVTATKTLLFDFESVRHLLTDTIVDNIEGITIGPTLPNGNQTLILLSDNNFNPTTIQINQFILLELIKNSSI